MHVPGAWLHLAAAVIGAVLGLELTRQILIRVGRKWPVSRRLVKRCHWPAVATAALMTFNIMPIPASMLD